MATTPDLTFTRRRVLRNELIGLYGVVERNLYLTKRYFLWDLAFLLWTIANTLTIVFISRGVDLTPAEQNELATKLLVGGVIWAYLGIIFEIVTETVAWERWEGTIEYTFMAPVSRPVHLIGMGVYAVHLRPRARGRDLRRRRRVHQHPPAARELRRRGRIARDRVGVVHRRRDDDRGVAPDLAGEGHAARASSRRA